MTNLTSAKSAINAELSHAKKGLAFYQARIDALAHALAQLENVDAVGDAPVRGKRGPKAKMAPVAAQPRGRKPGRPPKATKAKGSRKSNGSAQELPFTGGDFWPNLITKEPQSAPEILHAAVSRLGYEASKDTIKTLANRQTSALNSLVKSGKIQSEGSGRARRFFV
jgi:hypothetical protein